MLVHKTNYSLLHHNSFGLDVRSKEFVEYGSVAELQQFIKSKDPHKPLFHIGGGNNLLFTKDYDGIILHSSIKGIELKEDTTESVLLCVGAAEIWDEVVAYTVSNGYFGLENLSLIPSETGAAAVQNIGAYGAEAKDFIETVEVVELSTGKVQQFKNTECNFSYRYSNFKGPWKGQYAVTHVTLRLNKTFVPNIAYGALAQICTPDMDAQALREAIINVRQNKLPNPEVLGNAGSFFMNPVVSKEIYEKVAKDYPSVPHYEVEGGVKIPAGWLIEQCGWKGKALGRAAVYEKQALVLVNLGHATPEEIMNLSDRVCKDVKKNFGIEIHPEVNWI